MARIRNFAVMLGILLGSPAFAEDKVKPPEVAAKSPDIPEPTVSITRHSGQFGGVTVNYVATAKETYLKGEEPINDFIPPNVKIKVEFQGASAIVEGSSEVDPATFTSWSTSPAIASGRQFLRWRITFDITADGSAISASVRRPMVSSIRIPFDF